MRSRLPVLRQRRRYMVFVLESEDDSGLVQARDIMGERSKPMATWFWAAALAVAIPRGWRTSQG